MIPITQLLDTNLYAMEADLKNGVWYDAKKFEVLGEVTKDTLSFDVEPYVKKSGLKTYKDYVYIPHIFDEVGLFDALLEMKFKTASESFYSLIKASGIEINDSTLLILTNHTK